MKALHKIKSDSYDLYPFQTTNRYSLLSLIITRLLKIVSFYLEIDGSSITLMKN